MARQSVIQVEIELDTEKLDKAIAEAGRKLRVLSREAYGPLVLMNEKHLLIVLEYARLMSRHIAPITLPGHGGEMCDFYKDICVAAENGELLAIENDEFYTSVICKMDNILKGGGSNG